MMLSLDTAYRSFGGEVEASSIPTICRLSDSRRHQLWAIARFDQIRAAANRAAARPLSAGKSKQRHQACSPFAFRNLSMAYSASLTAIARLGAVLVRVLFSSG